MLIFSQKPDFFTVKLIDTLEIKGLGINFIDKKLYQLINKAN